MVRRSPHVDVAWLSSKKLFLVAAVLSQVATARNASGALNPLDKQNNSVDASTAQLSAEGMATNTSGFQKSLESQSMDAATATVSEERIAANASELRNMLDRQGNFVDAATVQLSEEGYVLVASLGDRAAMLTFAHKVLEMLGLAVTDESHFKTVVMFYDGECAVQSFEAMVREFNKGVESNSCNIAWLHRVNHSESTDFLQNQVAVHTKRRFRGKNHDAANESKADDKQGSITFGGMTVGVFAALNEEGYRAVASIQNKAEMDIFLRRVLEKEGLQVMNEGAFQGMLRYYDGECDTQSYGELVSELHRVLKQPESCFDGPWLTKK